VKDIHDILRQKELDCARVQKEIEALRLVIPLLDGETLPETDARKQPEHESETASTAESTGTDGASLPSLTPSETSFWKRRR
jgi:hypothetical protein